MLLHTSTNNKQQNLRAFSQPLTFSWILQRPSHTDLTATGVEPATCNVKPVVATNFHISLYTAQPQIWQSKSFHWIFWWSEFPKAINKRNLDGCLWYKMCVPPYLLDTKYCYAGCLEPKVRPWSWVKVSELCALHIISMWWTFVPSYLRMDWVIISYITAEFAFSNQEHHTRIPVKCARPTNGQTNMEKWSLSVSLLIWVAQ